jgi:putative addiction module component (TIGR02574 family)
MNALTRTAIIRLSPHERLALIGDLWDSLSEAETPVTPPQVAEIERRLASFEQDRTVAVTWDQLKAERADRWA